ncbi:centrosomal protein of 55 kDa isoform X2 [Synchiropus splendidus]|uniref:centrosomal protein of 55 kDa isoform X2 n=1 Tax=Synchiropus splendidus TaxID=270530 RepID=UPI00237E02CD|nr:centrosomal protein of 55 kDa isoform X2 [Synchiropus splendidus]
MLRFKSQKKKGATGEVGNNYITFVIHCGQSAMASKGVKDSLVNKFGIRSHGSVAKSEMELERVRKENAHLKKKLDELKCHVKSPDSERPKLLEVVASLQAQLTQQKQAVEQKDELLQSMSKEMESLKSMNQQATVGGLSVVQDQLRDALEKNRHWLVYDQQREAYVQSVVARSLELEKQLANVKLQQEKNETSLDGSDKEAQLQVDYKQLILEVQSQKDQVSRTQDELIQQKAQTSQTQAELQSQREQVIRLQGELMVQKKVYEDKCGELSSFSDKYMEKCSELEKVKFHLQKVQQDDRNIRFVERWDSEQEVRMKEDLERINMLLEVERKKSTGLLQQVKMLQESLLSQVDQQRQMASLEQQVLLSTKDFESEKANRQCIHEELHKVLKELRKARDDISHLDHAKKEKICFSKPSSHNKHQHVIDDMRSCSRVTDLLDESFLECPNCQSTYPASRYRELLAHIELCVS